MGEGSQRDTVVTRRLDDAEERSVDALLTRVAATTGSWPLSDLLAADLRRPAQDDARRPISLLLTAPGSDELAGYGQASLRDGGWSMQVVVREGSDVAHVSGVLLAAALERVDQAGSGDVDWWVFDATPAIHDVATAHGFRFDRDLRQMRRPLPADRRSSVTTRAFVVGQDEQRWVDVNNRAFAGHPEQGGWTVETLRRRMDEPWFDAEGFRLHERNGRLAAFCWTKVHPDGAGEIYVIAVDPDDQGLGLGRELTLAGLDSMADRGVTDALLYVDGANRAGIALYEQLGFVVRRIDVAFRRPQ